MDGWDCLSLVVTRGLNVRVRSVWTVMYDDVVCTLIRLIFVPLQIHTTQKRKVSLKRRLLVSHRQTLKLYVGGIQQIYSIFEILCQQYMSYRPKVLEDHVYET